MRWNDGRGDVGRNEVVRTLRGVDTPCTDTRNVAGRVVARRRAPIDMAVRCPRHPSERRGPATDAARVTAGLGSSLRGNDGVDGVRCGDRMHRHDCRDRVYHPAILHADAYASPWLGSTVPTSLLVMRPFASFQIWRR